MGKAKGSSAPSPDPNVGLAALRQAELGEEWLTVAKEQFDIGNERQKKIDALSEEVTRDQLNSSKQAQQWATEDRQRYKTVFEPLQDKFIETANNWDSAERQNKLASEAKADVMNASAQAQQQRERQMAAVGVNPTSGRYAGIESAADTNTALAAAGAQNNARNVVRNQAVAMRGDAVNMGSGLGVNPATSLGLGVQAGGAAIATTGAANQQRNANIGVLQGGYQTAMQGQAGMANTFLGQQQGQLNAWKANYQADSGFWSGVGSIAGMAIVSDEEAKENKRPVKGVLDAVKGMRVEQWDYKDGEGDEESHIGTYAQDFQRETGMGDGKTINVIDAIGVSMKATQELAEEVDELKQAVMAKPKKRSKSAEKGVLA